MKIDKDKKYEFLGDVYKCSGGYWESPSCSNLWAPNEFQHFAAKGAVKEVREPIVVTTMVEFNSGGWNGNARHDDYGLTEDQAAGRTYEITAREEEEAKDD